MIARLHQPTDVVRWCRIWNSCTCYSWVSLRKTAVAEIKRLLLPMSMFVFTPFTKELQMRFNM